MSSTTSSSASGPLKSPSSSKARDAQKSKRKSSSMTHGRSSPIPFTARMQDRQARNKDPHSSSDDEEELYWDIGSRRDPITGESIDGSSYGKGRDSYESVQKKREAAVILDNPELVMMHAQARNDSIPGTRHYFTKILHGFGPIEDGYPMTSGSTNGHGKSGDSSSGSKDRSKRADIVKKWP